MTTLPPTNPNLVEGKELEGADIEIPAEGVQLKVYQVRPRGVTTGPAVIVIHENRGLVLYVRDVADGLASSGYIAMAPDLLTREGGTEAVPDVPTILREIPRERFVTDVQAVERYLRSQPGITRIGVIGFCFGGGITWRIATESQDIAAAVPFYGGNPPLEAVPNIRAAVFGVYGELDDRINQGIPAIREAVKDAGFTFDMKVYPQVPHGFHNPTGGGYNAEVAKTAWTDALTWFDRHLRG